MQAIALLPVEFRCKGAMMDGEETLTVSEGVARCKHDAVWEGQKKAKPIFRESLSCPPNGEQVMLFHVFQCEPLPTRAQQHSPSSYSHLLPIPSRCETMPVACTAKGRSKGRRWRNWNSGWPGSRTSRSGKKSDSP